MYDSIRRVLSRPGADVWILVVATLLVAPSITAGLAADDYFHELALAGSSHPIRGFSPPPLDLFRFASPEANRDLVNEGVLPWWIDPGVRFAFLRPLASLSHYVDYLLFGTNPVPMHVHSVAWGLLMLLGVRALYREIERDGTGPTWVASLALCFYAIDDARGPPVSWVANRNELISCALSVWAITCHVRGRRGSRAAAWLGPVALGVALFASEGAIAVTAYLFAYALFLDDGPLVQRLVRLWPYTVVVLAWGALYRGLGYGIHDSGVYFDPLHDPVEFLGVLPERFSMLWLSQLGGPWSEGWNAYAVMFPGSQYYVVVLAVLVIAGTLWLFTPLLRREPRARFWLLGAGIGTLPACGAFPADRLLPWVGIGAFGITAEFFAAFVERRAESTTPFHERAAAVAIVLAHLVTGPLLLPARSLGIAQIRAAIDRADRTVPSDPSVEQHTAVYLNPAADPFASYLPITRAALGVPRPKTQRWLSTSTTPVHVERIDERTLRVRPEGGFLILPSERLFRNTLKHPFRVGETIAVEGLDVTIASVTNDGRPAEVLARFQKPLEDPEYLWFAWREAGYAPYTPPAIGGKATAAPSDLVTVAYGPESAVTKALRGEPTSVAVRNE